MDLEVINQAIRDLAIPANYPQVDHFNLRVNGRNIQLNRHGISMDVPNGDYHLFLASLTSMVRVVRESLGDEARYVGPSHVTYDAETRVLTFTMYF